jgi:hypothetical protein
MRPDERARLLALLRALGPAGAQNSLMRLSDRELAISMTYTEGAIDNLRFGFSAAYGPYAEAAASNLGAATVSDFNQIVLGTDFSLELVGFRLHLEAIRNWWQVPNLTEGSLGMWGGYIEAQLDIVDRIYVALRYDQLYFDAIDVNGVPTPWDYHIARLEPALGFELAPGVRLKLVSQINLRSGPSSDPDDYLFASQLGLAL